jgi:cytochrome c-type biogenesis protein CcmF
MNLALGTAGVVLGLVSSIAAVVTLAFGLLRGRPDLLRLARVYTWLVLFAAALAVFAMERALITRDFTVLYVAKNGSSRTPPLFNVATMWGALEGSILLWMLFLAGYTALVGRKFRDRLADPLVAWALLTMFVVCVFFFGLLIGPANPFKAFSPPIGYDGPGPNPLLQNNPLMAFHPPMLYLGYVGFTVPERVGWSRPAAGPSSPGASSPSASSSVRGGATRCSAGVATGLGTRSRTPRSCRGSPAPPTCTR